MKTQTLELLIKFKEITGVLPKSARLWTGSMRGFVQFTIPYSEEVREFCSNDNFYQKKAKNFKGVEVEYLGNDSNPEWHKKHGYYFDVDIEKLMSQNR